MRLPVASSRPSRRPREEGRGLRRRRQSRPPTRETVADPTGPQMALGRLQVWP